MFVTNKVQVKVLYVCVAVLFALCLSILNFVQRNCTNTGWETQTMKLMDENLCLKRIKGKEKFHDVLLVIIFNYPNYTHVPLLKSFYSPEFPNITLCGPEESSHYGVTKMDISKGHFAYGCMTTAIWLHPKFEGYLFVNDDMIVNYWNFVHFDRRKIWQGPKGVISVDGYGPPQVWYWWKSRWGIKNCNRSLQEISEQIQTDSPKSLPFKQILKLSQTNEKTPFCSRGRSDIFYLPKKFAQTFITLAEIFWKNKVFHEITVPTISLLLDPAGNFEKIPGVYLPGRVGTPPVSDGKYLWTYYNTSIGFIHPIKFNNGSDMGLNKALFNNWLVPYSQSINICKKENLFTK